MPLTSLWAATEKCPNPAHNPKIVSSKCDPRNRSPHSHAASEKLNSVVRVVQTGPPRIELAGDAVDAWKLVSPIVSEEIL
jgi:hypothetical protein